MANKKEGVVQIDISIDKAISTPVYIQIKNQIRDMVYAGEILEDFLLPPERKLAKDLGVSRSTVVKAYEELKALGIAESHTGKGTRVTTITNDNMLIVEKKVNPLYWHQFFNSNTALANEHIIKDIVSVIGHTNIISFAAGVASRDFYPVEAIAKLQEKLWRNCGREMLTHSDLEGYYRFRESISEILKEKHIKVSPKEVMVLSGSQQGLDFISRTFISPGDVIILEEPTFMGAIQIFRMAGAKIIGVPMDEEGIKIDILEGLLNKYKPKFIYTIPTFQNPSGVVMSLQRRYSLLQLAYKYQVPIIEDDPYGEIRYEDNSVPALKALDKYNHVIYLSTFSKVLFSGMRVGYAAASIEVIKKFSTLKQMTDLHTNLLAQYILDSFIREGLYREHIKLVCTEYKKKRDIMAEALKNNGTSLFNYRIPKGGYYIWCSFPKTISQTKLWAKAAGKGVAYTPGNVFYPEENDGENYIRLNFTYESDKNIRIGVQKLLEAAEEAIKETEALDGNENAIYSSKPLV